MENDLSSWHFHFYKLRVVQIDYTFIHCFVLWLAILGLLLKTFLSIMKLFKTQNILCATIELTLTNCAKLTLNLQIKVPPAAQLKQFLLGIPPIIDFWYQTISRQHIDISYILFAKNLYLYAFFTYEFKHKDSWDLSGIHLFREVLNTKSNKESCITTNKVIPCRCYWQSSLSTGFNR